MKRWLVVSGLVLAISFAGWGQSICPAGAIASDSEVVTGVFGTVAIEVCVTRSGEQDTYSYRLTHLGGGTENPCGLLIPGIGRMDTVSTSGPTGWSSTTTTSSCGAWWTWSSGVLGSSVGSSLIGRALDNDSHRRWGDDAHRCDSGHLALWKDPNSVSHPRTILGFSNNSLRGLGTTDCHSREQRYTGDCRL